MIKRFTLTLMAFCLPVMMAVVVLPTSAHALFESSVDQACQGANLSDSASGCTAENGATRIEEVIGIIVNILTVIVGIAAVFMIIINGFRFITSNGDSGSIANARNGVIYAIVGLVVVALAQVIVRFVSSKL